MPTGGVTADNLRDWIDAGAVAVGAGGELVSTADLAAGRYDEVERKARLFSAAAAAVAAAAIPATSSASASGSAAAETVGGRA
jgi:2-dehydro-3-deoxyphosphogluconate aldolase/(4S)-4-hydroxy-2-oxoglutarate aldolase